jgi:hypothetical protein
MKRQSMSQKYKHGLINEALGYLAFVGIVTLAKVYMYIERTKEAKHE